MGPVKNEERRSTQLCAAVAVVAMGLACSPVMGHRDARASKNQSRASTIDQLTPARDSIGTAPLRFAWTSVQGADRYAIGVWNEVDQLLWREDNILTTSVTPPENLRLEPGTYFWSVSALRAGQQLAESGLAAFMVRTTP